MCDEKHKSERDEMRKVLYVIASTNIGGAETMLWSLLHELDNAQFRASVCVVGGGPVAGQLARWGYATHVMKPFSGFCDLVSLRRLMSIVREEAPNVIHTHGWIANFYSAVCARIRGVPCVSTFHSMTEIETVKERLAFRIVARLSNAMVFVCEAQERHFRAAARMRHCCVIRNGLRLNAPRATSAEGDSVMLREELCISAGNPVVTCVASLRPGKGHEVLLEAWTVVIERFPTARLLLLGDGICRASLERLRSRLNISRSVSLLGERSDVRSFLSITDVFVLASFSECLSYAIMEAMSMACPIVVTEVGGNTELVQHREDGLLVPPGDPSALAEGLGYLLLDRETARRFGQAARVKVERHFTARRMVQSYEDLYRDNCSAPWRGTALGKQKDRGVEKAT